MKRRLSKIITAGIATSVILSSVSMMAIADTVEEGNPQTEVTETETETNEAEATESDEAEATENTDVNTEEDQTTPEEDCTIAPDVGINGFIKRLYVNALGREAEEAGLIHWADSMTNGQPAVEVVSLFLDGDEFKSKDISDEEYVEIMYNTLFGREADEAGLNYWVEQLGNGATRRFVLAGFANSDEFQNLCDSFGVIKGEFSLSTASDMCPSLNAFVALAYEGVLGRTPDEAGLSFWVDQIASGKTACDMLSGFFDSDEIANKNLTNEEFVTLCYKAFLLREPDEAGLQMWVSLFDQGLSKRYIMSRIAESTEFKNLCDEYGVTSGKVALFEYRDMYPEYTKFINNAYTQMVGEAPTANTINNYLAKIRKGTKTLRDVTEDIAELGSGRDSTTWINSLYAGALGRGCSASELQSQLETLSDSGKGTVIEAIIESDEFTSHCESLGIVADSTKRLERGANGALYGYSMENEPLSGWNYIDGLKYFFYEDGTLCQDIRDIIGDQDSYYLTINTANNIIMVYTWDDETDGWNIPVVAFVASCGKPGTETILGDYTLHSQSRWGLMMGGVYCQYLTRIDGNFLIHSECYSTTNVYTMDTWGYSLLGQAASHGCVRTTCANAKWVYEHCNECPVHIYNDASVSAPFDKPVPPPFTGTFDPTDPLCQ